MRVASGANESVDHRDRESPIRDYGKISETALFVDIIGIMHQVGLTPLPLQTGASIIAPGPRTHDGVMFGEQDPQESKKTIDLIKRMIDDLVSSGVSSPSAELRRTWHEDMLWWGPAGIGATYTINRYQQQHQGPFRDCLKDIVFEGHRSGRSVRSSFSGPPASAKPSSARLSRRPCSTRRTTSSGST